MSWEKRLKERQRVVTVYESKAIDSEAGIYDAWITRQSPDRVGDIVVATGGRFENFEKNPVVLWSHGENFLGLGDNKPVARSLKLIVESGVGVLSEFQFAPFGTTQLADDIHRLWRAGFLNAVSIGLLPIKAEPVEGHEDEWLPPMIFHEWELLEFSIVALPMHQDALRRALKYTLSAKQRRRQRRRIKERERNGRQVAPVEPVIEIDSELLSRLANNLRALKGAFKNG